MLSHFSPFPRLFRASGYLTLKHAFYASPKHLNPPTSENSQGSDAGQESANDSSTEPATPVAASTNLADNESSKSGLKLAELFEASVAKPEEGTAPKDSVERGLSKTFRLFDRVDAHKSLQNEPQKSFAHLVRNSKLMQLGDPEGRIVEGIIFDSIADDLYIDFGGKFHCVCPRPKGIKGAEYRRGKRVKLRLSDLELTARFIGAERDMTLLEADATLIGLAEKSKEP